jgi:3',5'-cyclic AMP phosphodiesterase CpdA
MSLRFLITSDLHYGANEEGDRSVRELAEHIGTLEADALLLGGDLATGPQKLVELLQLFQSFPGARLAVPGNHDIWLAPGAPGDSWAVHEELLPRIFERFGFHALHISPRRVGDVAFVGSMGWYDYSFRDDIGVELEWYRKKTMPGTIMPIWADARYARFPEDDEALTNRLLDRLAEQLRAPEVQDAPHVVPLIHHLCTRELLVHPRELVPFHWRFANAFLGAQRFSELLDGEERVTQVYNGHSHMSRTAQRGHCTYTSVGSTYRAKMLLTADPTGLLDRRLFGTPGGF